MSDDQALLQVAMGLIGGGGGGGGGAGRAVVKRPRNAPPLPPPPGGEGHAAGCVVGSTHRYDIYKCREG